MAYKVLVVDESEPALAAISDTLSQMGYEVESLGDTSKALSFVRTHEIDAFIIDIGLPDLRGIELCRQIRDLPHCTTKPILSVTNLVGKTRLKEAFGAGCDDFVVKPVDPIVLNARLRGLLDKVAYMSRLECIKSNLQRYVSPRIQQLVENFTHTGEVPDPEEREICILFSDIRGFTAMSQQIAPSVLFASVSQHLGAQVETVYRHGGYVDKFGGDGIMAVFDGDNMVEEACRCAMDIMDVAKISPPLSESPIMPVGIGIHIGPAVVGNIGTGDHLDYSAIGNTVNLAARLCGQAGSMDIIVSDDVKNNVQDLGGFHFSDAHQAHLRGVNGAVGIYRLSRSAESPEAPQD